MTAPRSMTHLRFAPLCMMLVVLHPPQAAVAQDCRNVPVDFIHKNIFWYQAPAAGSTLTVGLEGGTAGVPTATIDGITQGVSRWTVANQSGSGVNFVVDLNNTNANVRIRLENTVAYGTIPASVCGGGETCAGYMDTQAGFTGTVSGGTMGVAKGMTLEHTRYVVLHELAHLQGLDHVSAPVGTTLMAHGTGSNYSMDNPSPCDVLNTRDVAKTRRAEYRRDPCNGAACGVNADARLPRCAWGGDPQNGWCFPPNGGPPFVSYWMWFPTKWDVGMRWWPSPIPPVGGITSPLTVGTSGSITLAAIDQDGKVMRVDWYVDGAPVYTALEDPFSLPYSGVAPGNYSVQARIWDDGEGTAWTPQVTVTVQAGGGGSSGGGVAVLPTYLSLWSYSNGLYLSAQGDSLVANQASPQTLTAQALGGGKYALRAPYNGYYVAAEGGGGGLVRVNRETALQWETFDGISLGGSDVAFRTYDGIHYLVVDPSTGVVSATATSTSTATRFRY